MMEFRGLLRIASFWLSVGVLVAGVTLFVISGKAYQPMIIAGALLVVANGVAEWYRQRKFYGER